MLSAIIASAAPNRYGRQSRLRSAANLRGAATGAGSAGGGARSGTCAGSVPHAPHMITPVGQQEGHTLAVP